MKYILVLYRKYLPGNLRRIIYGLIIKPYLLFINDPKVFLVDWKWHFKLLFEFYFGKGKQYPIEYREAAKFSFLYGPSLVIGNFVFHYLSLDIKVFLCEKSNLYYVLFDGKKLYFKRGLTEKEVQSSYKSLLLEQDSRSPHSYVGTDFKVDEGAVLFDVGAAEGIFTLANIEKIRHAYLFECENEWIEALNMTFSFWKEKITIVQKYVSNANDIYNISLDDFANENLLPDYVKMDIEGSEYNALLGAINIIRSKTTKWAVCVYHKHEDEKEISSLFSEYNYKQSFSTGLMFVQWNDDRYPICPPYFRKGVLRLQK